jgi:hypothetical protein
MPPGIYAPTVSTPSAKLKTLKGGAYPTAGMGGVAPAGGSYGAPPVPPAAPTPNNPTTMNTYGGQTQQTDQMGRVITTRPGTTGLARDANGNVNFNSQTSVGFTQIEDPDQQRRARDLADEQTRVSMYQPKPGTGGSPGASPGPGIDINEVPGWLDKFKPDAVPREPGLTTLPREVGKGPEDRTAAESAAFSRAAERIANIGKGNLNGLRNQMTRRGITGSGIEAAGVRDVQNNTAGQLGEVVRDQAIEGLHRQEAIDDRDLAAGISQRGQDLGIQSTNYTGGIAQRGQDVSQADWKLNALPSILALLRLKSGGS